MSVPIAPIHRGYRDPRLVGKGSSDTTGSQTPGNPDLSGLHTPYFINLLDVVRGCLRFLLLPLPLAEIFQRYPAKMLRDCVGDLSPHVAGCTG